MPGPRRQPEGKVSGGFGSGETASNSVLFAQGRGGASITTPPGVIVRAQPDNDLLDGQGAATHPALGARPPADRRLTAGSIGLLALFTDQALARVEMPKSLESNGELRKTG